MSGAPAPGRCDVVHIVWSGHMGGIEQLTATLVRAAAARGGTVHRVCFIDGEGVIADALVAEGLAVRARARSGLDPVGLWRFARLLRELRPRVVQSYTHALGANLVAAVAVPRAVRVYDEQSPRALRGDRKLRLLYRLLRVLGARFVVPAPTMARALGAYGFEPDRIAIVPNPLRIALRDPGVAPATGRPTLGVVARLEPQKRVELLLDVLAELRRDGLDCAGLIVGDGSEREALERRADAIGLRDVVEFAGEATDVVPLLDRLDVFLSTSASEPFGIASLEAMARGVPVVAMPCPGGLGDLVGRGGVVLPDREIGTAAATVKNLLESPDERAAIRERADSLLGEHEPARVLDAFERLYAEAIEPAGTHPVDHAIRAR